MEQQVVNSIMPLIAIVIGIITTAGIVLLRNRPNLREAVSVVGSTLTFLLIFFGIAPIIEDGKIIEYTICTVLPGIDFKLKVDALGVFFATTASFLWIVAAFYTTGYMRINKEHRHTRFFACYAIAVFSAIGVAFSANLFTLYLFYELLSIMTYPLVVHQENDDAWEGSKKYIVYLVGLSKTFLLGAVVLTYMLTGTLDFQAGGIFTGDEESILVILCYIGFIFGFAKAGYFPIHHWLPAAMVAPTPVSGLLHAVAVVKVGVFSVVRIMLDIFGIDMLTHFNLGIPTAIFVSFTIIGASMVALTKDDLKARLAYSTISQLSYIILGVALMAKSSVMGGVLHIVNHAFSKITLFFCAGSIYVQSHIKKISLMGGIGRKMPVTMACFTIGALSMIGIPAVAGFTSKWYIAIGAIEAEEVGFIFILLASTVLNAAYFLPVIYQAYFGEDSKDPHFEETKEAPPIILIPLVVLASMTIIIGIWPDYFLNIAKMVVNNSF